MPSSEPQTPTPAPEARARGEWRPLLTGRLAERAWSIVRGIAAELANPEAEPDQRAAWSLPGGSAGIALFHAYLARSTGKERYEDAACNHLEAALEGAASQPYPPGLWGGVLGPAFVYDHLSGVLFEEESDDGAGQELTGAQDADAPGPDESTSDADLVLLRYLDDPRHHGNFDLILGLVGLGIACLEGLPRGGARRALDRVLDLLLDRAERRPAGVTWFTPPDQLPAWQRELAPAGHDNLGVAHGTPAVLLLLARCAGAGIRADEIGPLLEAGVRFLLAQSLEGGFPSWIPRHGTASQPARLAWCYGDPGLAAALLAAARAAGRDDWRARALEIGRRAASRDPDQAGIRDAGLCHGAAGLGHLFHRLHRGTGCPRMAEAARYWLERAIDMHRPGEGVGGYVVWTLPRGREGREPEGPGSKEDSTGAGDEIGWYGDPGLLTGSAGIGLCLLAALTHDAPDWDRALAISAPEGRP